MIEGIEAFSDELLVKWNEQHLRFVNVCLIGASKWQSIEWQKLRGNYYTINVLEATKEINMITKHFI